MIYGRGVTFAMGVLFYVAFTGIKCLPRKANRTVRAISSELNNRYQNLDGSLSVDPLVYCFVLLFIFVYNVNVKKL